MQTYYHTFGLGHPQAGRVQPIVAENATEALRAMFKKYGNRWAFQYTQKEWETGPASAKTLRTIKVPIKKYKENGVC